MICSPHQIINQVIKLIRIKWAGQIALMEENRGVYTVLVQKAEGKRPHGRQRYRWEDNIMMEL